MTELAPETIAAYAEAEQLLSRSRALSTRVATHNLRVVNESDGLSEEVRRLASEIAKAKAALPAGDWNGKNSSSSSERRKKSRSSNGGGRSDGGGGGGEDYDDEEDDEPPAAAPLAAAEAVLRGHGPGGDLRKLLKNGKPPRLLAALCGSRVSVVTPSRKAAIALKEEYHAFRDRGGVILTVASLALLLGLHRADARAAAGDRFSLAPPLMVGVQAMLAWLAYFYVALALREQILVANGSSIRRWWISHHAWSAGTAALVLSLPIDSPAVRVFLTRLLRWSAAQGVVMILQNRYQRRRMYTRIALGRNAAMDVVSGETSGSAGQLLALYPFLFGLQIAQVAVGAQMLSATLRVAASPEGWLDQESAGSDLRGSRGVAVAGAAMVFMGCCNFANTISTIVEKKKTRHVRRRGWGGVGGGMSRGASAGNMRASSSSGAFPVSPTAAAAFGGALAGSNNSNNAAAKK